MCVYLGPSCPNAFPPMAPPHVKPSSGRPSKTSTERLGNLHTYSTYVNIVHMCTVRGSTIPNSYAYKSISALGLKQLVFLSGVDLALGASTATSRKHLGALVAVGSLRSVVPHGTQCLILYFYLYIYMYINYSYKYSNIHTCVYTYDVYIYIYICIYLYIYMLIYIYTYMYIGEARGLHSG